GRKDPVYSAIHTMLSQYFLKRETVEPPKLVDGRWLMKQLHLPEGPVIGRLLAAIREAQATGRVKTTAQALALAETVLKDRNIATLLERNEKNKTGGIPHD
ncbi:MAG TPA: hypothetical protein P5079_11770, partial [Elusimicrobiota bacterium]|nr:hypothetical protein [Elusimicrobiota bacterium]